MRPNKQSNHTLLNELFILASKNKICACKHNKTIKFSAADQSTLTSQPPAIPLGVIFQTAAAPVSAPPAYR